MATLEDKFSSLYGTEAYGGVATVFIPGIQGASVAGPRGDKGPKGDTVRLRVKSDADLEWLVFIPSEGGRY